MPCVDTIPAELRHRPQWVLWRYEARGDGKPTKVPYRIDGQMASTNDPATWAAFGEVLEADGFSGIGFVFSPDDPYIGVDLDNSIGDDGRLKPWAEKIVVRFNTYTEVSPSGKGVKMWCRGKYAGPGTGKRIPYKDGKVEMYHERRYFAVTGNRYPDTPDAVNDAQSAVDDLCKYVLTPKPAAAPSKRPAEDATERCVRYIEKCGPAISGQGGHDRTFHAACECFRFGLSESEAWRVMEWYNATKAQPAWSERELRHKIADAFAAVRQEGQLGARLRQIDPPRVPITSPPVESSGLERVIGETVDGKRVNIEWPWPIVTDQARALLPGTVTVVTGMGGSSKSLLVSEACIHWLETGVSFAVFHLEEDREFHQLRAMAQLEGDSRLTRDDYMRDEPEAVYRAHDKYKKTLDALGASIWDAPASDVSLTDLEAWVRERASEGRRVIVVDPVTAADSGREPWMADRRFVLGAKRVMRESGSSLIVVTHPRDGNPKHGGRMDNHAGGQAYNRFTQCVLDLEVRRGHAVSVEEETQFGATTSSVNCNRTLSIRKSRNGPGAMKALAYWFDPATLRFHEKGIING